VKKRATLISIVLIFAILLIDQIIKIWVKTHMTIGEDISVIDGFFSIQFIENMGMAFGMEFWGKWGKLGLSIFRMIAISGLVWYIVKLIKTQAKLLFIICISMVIAGATGNLIDCAVYGLIFNESTTLQVASIFPPEGGYAGFLTGKVVDMFYITAKIGDTSLFPFIFNIADASITISVLIMIVFYNRVFGIKKQTIAEPVEHDEHCIKE